MGMKHGSSLKVTNNTRGLSNHTSEENVLSMEEVIDIWRKLRTHELLVIKHTTAISKPSSLVSTVSDYGLDGRAIEVRSPAEAKRHFSSILCVQTGSGAHPASCTMGTVGPFPGLKRGRGVTLTTHPHLVPRSRMSRSYTSSSRRCLHGV
jgi:hypothetical protein